MSPRNTYKLTKIQNELDDDDRDVLWSLVLKFFDGVKYPKIPSIHNNFRQKTNYTVIIKNVKTS